MRVNLAIMIYLWGVSIFNFYMLMYLVNSFKQVYMTALMLGIADLLAYLTGGLLVAKIGIKTSFFVFLLIGTLSGVLMLCYGLQN